MEDDTFPVDANQAKLISENKKWIEYLFRVELNIYSSNDQDACRYLCKIVVYCEDAQEILVKTKVSIPTYLQRTRTNAQTYRHCG